MREGVGEDNREKCIIHHIRVGGDNREKIIMRVGEYNREKCIIHREKCIPPPPQPS
jgi:hypothetical protein